MKTSESVVIVFLPILILCLVGVAMSLLGGY